MPSVYDSIFRDEPNQEAPAQNAPEPKKKKHGFFMWFLVLLGVLLMLTGVGLITRSMLVPPVPDARRDMDNNWVVPEEPEDPVTIEKMKAVDELPGGIRFQVPSVKLDVPLGAMNAVDNIINPPGFFSAFWVRNMGTSLQKPEKGTVYVAAHSLRHGGRGPGNYLIDVNKERAVLEPGSVIIADGVRYVMTEARSIPKVELSKEGDLWKDVPGRIVVITCLQRPDNGNSRNNIVIIGMLEDMSKVANDDKEKSEDTKNKK